MLYRERLPCSAARGFDVCLGYFPGAADHWTMAVQDRCARHGEREREREARTDSTTEHTQARAVRSRARPIALRSANSSNARVHVRAPSRSNLVAKFPQPDDQDLVYEVVSLWDEGGPAAYPDPNPDPDPALTLTLTRTLTR